MVEGFTELAVRAAAGVVVIELGMIAGLVVAESAATAAAFFSPEGLNSPIVAAKI